MKITRSRSYYRWVLAALMLPALSACWQLQLFGPVAGSAVRITELRSPGTEIFALESADTPALIARYGQAVWEQLGSAGRLWLLGTFGIETDGIVSNRLYLVTASRGEDTDSDADGLEDDNPTPVAGEWRAIVTGAQLKTNGPKVSALSEAVYLWLRDELSNLDDQQVVHNIARAAAALVSDVNGDGRVTVADLLLWSRLFDTNRLLADPAQLDVLTRSVVDDADEDQRQATAQSLIGLAVDFSDPANGEGPEALSGALWGLSVAEFFSASWRALLHREPEIIVRLGAEEKYGLQSTTLNNISDGYVAETFDLVGVVLDTLRDIDREGLGPQDQLSYDVYQW